MHGHSGTGLEMTSIAVFFSSSQILDFQEKLQLRNFYKLGQSTIIYYVYKDSPAYFAKSLSRAKFSIIFGTTKPGISSTTLKTLLALSNCRLEVI